jgi:glutathione S-transferase
LRREDELDGKNYLAGNYGLADNPFTSNLARQIELDVGLPARYPHIRAWVDRLISRPNRRAIAEFVPSTDGIVWSDRQLSGARVARPWRKFPAKLK